ncbi:MAG: TMEM175 family protein [Bacteroidota bacterium]
MNKTRIEAFSDGVLAIIITIMVLEIKIPHEVSLEALTKLLPVFSSYFLSFLFIGLYWANHHHVFHTVKKVNSKIIWANMGLLFSLSLIPFTTGWMGENHYAELPVALYCINLFVCGVAAYILQLAITHGLPEEDSVFVVIKSNMRKTVISVMMNIISIPCAFFYPMVSLFLIAILVIMWIIPDKRIEQLMAEEYAS